MMKTGLEPFEASSVGRFAREFEDAFDRRDFAHMARFYANDAWLIGENTGVIKGRPAVEAFHSVQQAPGPKSKAASWPCTGSRQRERWVMRSACAA